MKLHHPQALEYARHDREALEAKVSRAPAWLRVKILRTSWKTILRKNVRFCAASRPNLPPRPGVDSGREAEWFLGFGKSGWMGYARARRALAFAGIPDTVARRVALLAARNFGVVVFAPEVDGAIPEPPIGSREVSSQEVFGWDVRTRWGGPDRSAEEARRVRCWTGWFADLDETAAVPTGMRMRRWLAIRGEVG